MFLGIEIGGTKLQLGVGHGDGSPPVNVMRNRVDAPRGAGGILNQIERCGHELLARHRVRGIGIGFGGPVDVANGRVIKSHQINGWENMQLAEWCQRTFAVPAWLENDCNAAALAEARFGAGRDRSIVFFVTAGTGVGGGLVVNGRLWGRNRLAVAEIGHLRPGLDCEQPDATVESFASGRGITAAAQRLLGGQPSIAPVAHIASQSEPQSNAGQSQVSDRPRQTDRADLMRRCSDDLEQLTAEMVAQAAHDGNLLAAAIVGRAIQALGWAIAQMITLLAPDVVVVGGGVSEMGQMMFFEPLRHEVGRYVFPPLLGSCQIVPAALGDLVVLHGALAVAAQESEAGSRAAQE